MCVCVCVCVCRKIDNNDPSGKRDLDRCECACV